MTAPRLPATTWLRAFEAAARHLSFTAAGRELNLTQSAVSQHVRSLEDFLDARLFERGPRTLSLTEDGANYLPAVREAFAVLAAGARPHGPARAATVTLQCNMGFAIFRLVPCLGAFAAAHPALRLDLVTPVWDPQRTAMTADAEIRFALRRAEAGGAPEAAYPVCDPATAARIAGGADWRAMPLFDCAGVLAGWPAWLAARGEDAGPAGRVHRASSFAASIGAALAGAGIAMAHGTLVAPLLAQGRLARPFEGAIDMPEGYALRRPAPHLRTRASAALAAWIAATFPELPEEPAGPAPDRL